MLDELANLATSKQEEPSNEDMVRYLFFTMGISEREFNDTSIPYIINVMNTHSYVKKEEEKAHKKASKRR